MFTYLLTVTTTELRGCVKVDVDVLAPVPNKRMVSVDVKQHFNHHHNYFFLREGDRGNDPVFFSQAFNYTQKLKKEVSKEGTSQQYRMTVSTTHACEQCARYDETVTKVR